MSTPASIFPQLTSADRRVLLRQDFQSFVERTFIELKPAQRLLMAPSISLMMTRLEDYRSSLRQNLIGMVSTRQILIEAESLSVIAASLRWVR